MALTHSMSASKVVSTAQKRPEARYWILTATFLQSLQSPNRLPQLKRTRTHKHT